MACTRREALVYLSAFLATLCLGCAAASQDGRVPSSSTPSPRPFGPDRPTPTPSIGGEKMTATEMTGIIQGAKEATFEDVSLAQLGYLGEILAGRKTLGSICRFAANSTLDLRRLLSPQDNAGHLVLQAAELSSDLFIHQYAVNTKPMPMLKRVNAVIQLPTANAEYRKLTPFGRAMILLKETDGLAATEGVAAYVFDSLHTQPNFFDLKDGSGKIVPLESLPRQDQVNLGFHFLFANARDQESSKGPVWRFFDVAGIIGQTVAYSRLLRTVSDDPTSELSKKIAQQLKNISLPFIQALKIAAEALTGNTTVLGLAHDLLNKPARGVSPPWAPPQNWEQFLKAPNVYPTIMKIAESLYGRTGMISPFGHFIEVGVRANDVVTV